MATLINGNGNPRIYAAQDADLIAALAGDITGIAQIGNKFAATAVDANTISVADGVIVTKEGRRIQLDAGSTDMFVIPTGTSGVTNYYIIGYKLTTQSDDSQIAETFVQLMSSSSETITEDTFREGATDVYVSLYRVQQNGVNLGTITGLLPELNNIANSAGAAEDISYDNTVSGLDADNAQEAIDELTDDLREKAQYFEIQFSGGLPISNHQANLNSMWEDFPQGISVIRLTDGSTVWHGTMEKYSDTYGSILYTSVGGEVRKYVKYTNTCQVIPDESESGFTLTSLLSNITLSFGRSARVGKVVYVKRIFTGTRANPQTTTAVGAGVEFITGFPKGDWMTDLMLIDGDNKPYGTVRINENGNAYANIGIPEGTYSILGCYITTE